MKERSLLVVGTILVVAILLASSLVQVQATKPGSSVTPTIPLIQCNGGNAQWSSSTVTYTIDNVAGFSSDAVAKVQAGISEWNNAQSTYNLQSTTDTPNITIKLFNKIIPGFILGATTVNCQSTGNNIDNVEIDLGLNGLSGNGIQNVAAHEVGHALGLGHSNIKSDLMYPSFDHQERKVIFCPSNLDVGALTATTSSYTVTPWTALSC